jgi:uncharacterized damage-inducible protein DinB
MEFDTDHAVEILRSTPGTLRALLAQLSEPWVTVTEGEGTWSAYDIVGHLIHGEETDWIPRLRNILEHGEAQRFEPFDRFAQFEKSAGKALPDLLDEFERLRAENLRVLEDLGLTESQLELTGVHPELGVVTAAQLLATWVVHDLGHIAQIARVMAKSCGSEVGPWRQYLRVLND